MEAGSIGLQHTAKSSLPRCRYLQNRYCFAVGCDQIDPASNHCTQFCHWCHEMLHQSVLLACKNSVASRVYREISVLTLAEFSSPLPHCIPVVQPNFLLHRLMQHFTTRDKTVHRLETRSIWLQPTAKK